MNETVFNSRAGEGL